MKNNNHQEHEETLQASPEEEPAVIPLAEQKNAKERLYDKVPLTVNHLNVIIAVLVIALVAVLVIGTLRGNGVV